MKHFFDVPLVVVRRWAYDMNHLIQEGAVGLAERTEYAVVRFLDQNGYCHMVSDYVKGYSLMQYVKMELCVSKKCMFRWMTELAHQMEQYSKCEEENAYGYVNPYAVIVTEEERILLLDAGDQESEVLVKRMQKKKVRALFVRRKRVLSQRVEREDDFYGFAKTIQFMAAKLPTDDVITRKEERILRKVVDRCLEGKKADVREWKEIQKELRKLESEEAGTVPGEGRLRRLGIAAVVTVAAAAGVVFWQSGRETKRAVIQAESQEKNVGNSQSMKNEALDGTPEEESEDQSARGRNGADVQEEQRRLSDAPTSEGAALELGLIYLADWQDYAESCRYLELAAGKNELAGNYLTIARSLQRGGAENLIKREVERAVEDIRLELKPEFETAETERLQKRNTLYQLPLLYGYELLESKESALEIVEIGELLDTDYEWSEDERSRERQVKKCMAKAYERLGELEKAIQMYERLKEFDQNEEEKETIYLRMEALYEERGEADKAWGVCKEAVEKLPEAERIQIHYIRRQLADKKVERKLCAEAVKMAIQNCPELEENEEFKALQEEYEIVIEGNRVVVGK